MKILIAEDDPVSCRILAANLKKWGHDVVVTHNGHDAWRALHTHDAPALAILDRVMPDVDGIEICRQLRNEKTDTPVHVILLTSLNRREDLLEGLEAGADDYLTKPLDTHELRARLQAAARILELQESLRQRVRELEAAIAERKLAEEALRNLSLTDQLTGLYNYRGFLNLAEHHARTSRRSQTRSLLIYADMDGLKEINDTLGHRAGSTAISAVAEILRRTFRDCDIIARLGGDEFAILVPNVQSPASATLLDRLEQSLHNYNEAGNHEFTIALSIGAVEIDHEEGLNIEDQMARADAVMYREKRKKKEGTKVVSRM
jgi:diguanylate cyclase (GGDEF)-like protein